MVKAWRAPEGLREGLLGAVGGVILEGCRKAVVGSPRQLLGVSWTAVRDF